MREVDFRPIVESKLAPGIRLNGDRTVSNSHRIIDLSVLGEGQPASVNTKAQQVINARAKLAAEKAQAAEARRNAWKEDFKEFTF